MSMQRNRAYFKAKQREQARTKAKHEESKSVVQSVKSSTAGLGIQGLAVAVMGFSNVATVAAQTVRALNDTMLSGNSSSTGMNFSSSTGIEYSSTGTDHSSSAGGGNNDNPSESSGKAVAGLVSTFLGCCAFAACYCFCSSIKCSSGSSYSSYRARSSNRTERHRLFQMEEGNSSYVAPSSSAVSTPRGAM